MTVINGHINLVKASDQSKTNDNTLGDDDDLKFAVLNGETWLVEIVGFVNVASADPDFQFALNGPAATDIRFCLRICDVTGVVGNSPGDIKTAWEDELDINYTGATDDEFVARGVFTASADGTFARRWAQEKSEADATTVKRGSSLRAWRLG